MEFALVAAPFFAIVSALFEVGLIFLNQTSFERQVDQAARMVKTGQAQQLGWNRRDFREFLCDGLFVSSDCQSNLRIDVRTLGNIAASRWFTDDELVRDGAMRLGNGEDSVLIRADLDYSPIFSAGGMSAISNAADGVFTFSAAMAFRNEPF